LQRGTNIGGTFNVETSQGTLQAQCTGLNCANIRSIEFDLGSSYQFGDLRRYASTEFGFPQLTVRMSNSGNLVSPDLTHLRGMRTGDKPPDRLELPKTDILVNNIGAACDSRFAFQNKDFETHTYIEVCSDRELGKTHPRPTLALFVRGGERFEGSLGNIPSGRYFTRLATGKVWFGPNILFGPEGKRVKYFQTDVAVINPGSCLTQFYPAPRK
jgi:hypothetical protein